MKIHQFVQMSLEGANIWTRIQTWQFNKSIFPFLKYSKHLQKAMALPYLLPQRLDLPKHYVQDTPWWIYFCKHWNLY
jgi:hypothetical protein